MSIDPIELGARVLDAENINRLRFALTGLPLGDELIVSMVDDICTDMAHTVQVTILFADYTAAMLQQVLPKSGQPIHANAFTDAPPDTPGRVMGELVAAVFNRDHQTAVQTMMRAYAHTPDMLYPILWETLAKFKSAYSATEALRDGRPRL